MFLHRKMRKFFVLLLGAVFTGFIPKSASAQATLLLEEPYSYDGTFAGTLPIEDALADSSPLRPG